MITVLGRSFATEKQEPVELASFAGALVTFTALSTGESSSRVTLHTSERPDQQQDNHQTHQPTDDRFVLTQPADSALDQLQFAPAALTLMRGDPAESMTATVYRPAGPETVSLAPPVPDAAPLIRVVILPLPEPVTVSVTGALQVTVRL